MYTPAAQPEPRGIPVMRPGSMKKAAEAANVSVNTVVILVELRGVEPLAS